MKELRENPSTTGRGESCWVWVVLAGILALYVFSALRVHPVATFGTSADDALYFSTAQALAAGKGYIIPGFPGGLQATKYPELYPLLLAGIWKINPHFPDNVKFAVGMTLFFGCAALVLIFLMLRRWPGLDDWQALAVASLCGFSGYFLYLSACVRTEIPFTAVLLAAVLLAERRGAGSGAAFGAGVLASLAVGLRSLGVAAVAGIGLAMLLKREYRRLLWFTVAATPLTLLSLWPALSAILNVSSRATAQPGTSGWTQTLCYYTSYACGWRMDVGAPATLAAVVLKNLKGVLQGAGMFLLNPLATENTLWSLVLVSLLGIAAYVGVVRLVRKTGWHSLVIVFTFYLLVILPWPYTPERFLLTFLPLLFGGLWLEFRHLAGLIAEHLRPIHSTGERVTAGLLAVAGLTVAALVVMNYTRAVPAEVAGLAASNEEMLAGERGAYDWVRQHAAPGASIIAYEDGLLYLYTGHPSILPIMAHTQDFYLGDRSFAEYDAARLADVASHVGADYWLTTTIDYGLTDELAQNILLKRQHQLLASAPVVYRSEDSEVKVYDVRALFGNGGDSKGTASGSRGSGSVLSRAR